ncbi:MAG: hypothetical protein P4M09_09540 [Devosia sp.]|nr:hypothetical protein [Devosia sp.]
MSGRRALVRRLRKPVRVVVYGVHAVEWYMALGPTGPVWATIPEVICPVYAADAAELAEIMNDGEGEDSIVLPMLEDHIRACSGQYRGLLPEVASVNVLADKAQFARYVARQGLERLVPASYGVDNVVFPCVLKRTDGCGGWGVAVAWSARELAELLEDERWQGQPVVLQEYVPAGPDFTTHCVCRDGYILWHTSYAYELERGEVVQTPQNIRARRLSTVSDRDMRTMEALLRPLRYDGPVNIDYRRTSSGDMRVLEINPRWGGSLMRPENLDHLRSSLITIIANARQPATVGVPEPTRRSADAWSNIPAD